MGEEHLTLSELMFAAEQYCTLIETHLRRGGSVRSSEELGLKIGQCRNLLGELQKAYNDDELTLANGLVKAQFRFLIMALIWVMFEARDVIDRKACRILVSIESTFTYLLIQGTAGSNQSSR